MDDLFSSGGPSNADLQERRRALGLTAAELAQFAGVSVSSVGLLETGYRPKSSPALERIEAALLRFEQGASATFGADDDLYGDA